MPLFLLSIESRTTVVVNAVVIILSLLLLLPTNTVAFSINGIDVVVRRRRIITTTNTNQQLLLLIQKQQRNYNYQQQQQRCYSTLLLNNNNNNNAAATTTTEIPLFIINDDDDSNNSQNNMILPLPSSHLEEDELKTCYIYGIQLTIPIHQTIINHAIKQSNGIFGIICNNNNNNNNDSLIGTIGCTAKILLSNIQNDNNNDNELQVITTAPPVDEKEEMKIGPLSSPPQTILYRGEYRFIVKDIKQTIPYTVAVIEELFDDDINSSSNTEEQEQVTTKSSVDDDDDDDDDDDYIDEYKKLSIQELNQRILLGTKAYIDYKLKEATESKDVSLLEQSILEQQNMLSQQQLSTMVAQQAAEERCAVFEVFQSALIDTYIMPQQRYYAIAFITAELCDINNNIRKYILSCTDSIYRLQYICKHIEQSINMIRAKQMATKITDKTSEQTKDLQVGQPILPIWAKQIQKGMRIEYYWNEEYEWCIGTVIDDPIFIVDELIITVYFDDDQSTHKLPFTPYEKARWRPAS